MTIKYISAYLSLNYDHNRKKKQETDDYTYIKEYYESILNLNLISVIIEDNLTNYFMTKYSNNNISFYRPKLCNNMHPHDSRFVYFLEYILGDNSEYFMITDIADVVILNPIEKIINLDKNILYIGKENENILNNKWFKHKISKNEWCIDNVYVSDYQNIFMDKIILNCGTIFGHRDLIISFLLQTVSLMNNIYKYSEEKSLVIKSPIDMFTINYIAYKYFSTNIYNGNQLTTRFGDNIYDLTKCIKHK
jgi:hypothetical protein